jgi:hypothetical protein
LIQFDINGRCGDHFPEFFHFSTVLEPINVRFRNVISTPKRNQNKFSSV